MPIYEYECSSCGERTEAIQRFEDPPLTICPRCGGPLRKLFSAPAFHLKGSGWYATDYAGKKGGGEEGKEAREGGESKSEGKPSEGAGKADGEKAAKPAADTGSGKGEKSGKEDKAGKGDAS